MDKQLQQYLGRHLKPMIAERGDAFLPENKKQGLTPAEIWDIDRREWTKDLLRQKKDEETRREIENGLGIANFERWKDQLQHEPEDGKILDNLQTWRRVADALDKKQQKNYIDLARQTLTALLEKAVKHLITKQEEIKSCISDSDINGDLGRALKNLTSTQDREDLSQTVYYGGSFSKEFHDLQILNIVKILVLIKQIGGQERCIPQLLELLKNLPPLYRAKDIGEAMSAINPHKSAQQLMEAIHNTDEEADRTNFSRALYAIELGRLGVSDNTVKYLDIQYNLQVAGNKKIGFAHRITDEGKVGLFDEKNELVGYFELGDLTGADKQRRAAVLDITRELIFANPDTDDDIRSEFLKKYHEFFSEVFMQQTGIYFNNISLREQLWFFQFISNADEQTKKKTIKLARDFGRPAIRSFIALEQDQNVGTSIISLADSDMHEDLKQQIFSTHEEIIEVLDDIKQEAKKFFNDEKHQNTDFEEVANEIAKRACIILKDLSHTATQEQDAAGLIKKINETKRDVVIFSSFFKAIFKRKETIDFAEVRGLDFQKLPIDWLDDGTKKEMLEIARKNWQPMGRAGNGVVEEFAHTLNHGHGTDFYILKKDGKVVAFIRFDEPQPNRHRYAGSFNVAPAYHGSAIGEAIIKNALSREAGSFILDATVHPQIPVGTRYVEDVGFTITGVVPNYHDSGEAFLKITCDKISNQQYITKEAQQQQLIAQHISNDWQKQIGHGVIVLKFDPAKENDQVIRAIGELTDAGYIGSRYFSSPGENNKRYYVFELKRGGEMAIAA